ncbi:MAG: pyridoxal phosphate-dependent aminotransferase [Oscillospiraceae bacterium]|jgi:cystathionine beta-lyase|nr:pyridoxal phosphate-dependent aminotransferase [Oscillospiraceae bacterium]
MAHNFDEIIDRRGTYSIKYDEAEKRGKPQDALPLWVADMDFRTPECVTDALIEKARHGIFGYTDTDSDYAASVTGWFVRRHGWRAEENWLVKTPGVVPALHMAVKAFTELGDAVIIQQPVYYPFVEAVSLTGRKLVVNELVETDGYYTIDFDDFERKIVENDVKLFILCSPHNPVGRVWRREELERLAEICLRHGVIVVSDEIHADFVYPDVGHRHIMFASLSDEVRGITVTCTAPSKTFNLAGLLISNLFIADEKLRRAFIAEYERCGFSQLAVMGMVACKAAYDGGEPWLAELLTYLEGNMNYLDEAVKSRLPGVKFRKPEGTYLAWLDMRGLGIDARKLDDFVLDSAKLWLDEGRIFGAGGKGFERVNVACPRSVLAEAASRLERAIAAIG